MMALAGHIIQANINHSARAQDLLLQTMAELGLGLALVAEPYCIPHNNYERGRPPPPPLK